MSRNVRRGGLLWRLLAVLLVLSLIAAACGDDDDAGGTDTTATDDGGGDGDTDDGGTDDNGAADDSADDGADADGGDDGSDGIPGMPDDFDPEGTIRLARSPSIDNTETFDPGLTAFNGDRQKMQFVLGSLLLENADGGYDAFMAESYEIVDPQTIVLILPEGLTFSDGAPYDADAVVLNLKRNHDSPEPTHQSGMHTAFKNFFEDAVADSPTQVTITLNAPSAGEFVQTLASREGVIASPKQIAEDLDGLATNPASAGPYRLVEWDTTTGEIYERNPDFFRADDWPIFRIQVIYTPTGPQTVQGLTSDTVDLITGSPDDINTVSDPYVVQTFTVDFGYRYIGFCVTKPPFDNLMLRQAVQKGIDRAKLNQLGFGGNAEIAHGFWPDGLPQANPDIVDQTTYDFEEAKRLVEESGVTDLEFDLASVTATNYTPFVEIIQPDLEALGFTVNNSPENNIVEWLTGGNPGAFMLPGSRSGVDKYGRTFFPGSVQVTCDSTLDTTA